MFEEDERKGWGVKDYEDYLKVLLGQQKDLVAQDEANQQCIYEIKRKLSTKEKMEDEYGEEIATLTSINEELTDKVKNLETAAKALQRSLNEASVQVDQLKERVPSNSPPPSVAPIQKCSAELEACELERVSWDEWNELKDNMDLAEQQLEEAQAKIHSLEMANTDLDKQNSHLAMKVAEVTSNCINMKDAYTDVCSLLEDNKEQLALAMADLVMLTHQPLPEGERGNSLFAEVDDNRKVVSNRLEDLKLKYVALSDQFKRNTFNSSDFAAERAGLERMVAEVLSIKEQRDVVEVNILKKRLNFQDNRVRRLLEESRVPVKVLGEVGVAETRFIEGLLADAKEKNDELQGYLDNLTMAHMHTQQELLVSQDQVAVTKAQLVQALANRRIEFIDSVVKGPIDSEPGLSIDKAGPSAAPSMPKAGPSWPGVERFNPIQYYWPPAQENSRTSQRVSATSNMSSELDESSQPDTTSPSTTQAAPSALLSVPKASPPRLPGVEIPETLAQAVARLVKPIQYDRSRVEGNVRTLQQEVDTSYMDLELDESSQPHTTAPSTEKAAPSASLVPGAETLAEVIAKLVKPIQYDRPVAQENIRTSQKVVATSNMGSELDKSAQQQYISEQAESFHCTEDRGQGVVSTPTMGRRRLWITTSKHLNPQHSKYASNDLDSCKTVRFADPDATAGVEPYVAPHPPKVSTGIKRNVYPAIFIHSVKRQKQSSVLQAKDPNVHAKAHGENTKDV